MTSELIDPKIQALQVRLAELERENERAANQVAVAKLNEVTAREQEKAALERVAELTKANEALKRSIAHLTTAESLHSFLTAVLQEASQASGALSAAVFVYQSSSHSLQKIAFVTSGEVVDIATDPRTQVWRSPVPADHTPAWQVMKDHRVFWVNNDKPAPEHWGFGVAWHEQMGHKAIACFPLLIGDQALGFLGLCFASDEQPNELRLEQCWTLAQHVALALQMAKLAEEAKQAAVAKLNEVTAREQEKASQQRAAELAKANEALKRSLDSLASEPSLEKFLGQVLSTIAAQFNSPIAEYWYHPENIAFIGMMSYYDQIYDREEISKCYPTHPGVEGFVVPPEMIHGEELHHCKQYFITEDWLSDPFTKDVKWVPEHGLHKQINVPMVLGDECVGALIVRMSRDHQITTQQIELAQALAHQATLAAQLTQLSQRTQETAILEERNRMAGEIHDTLAQSFTGIVLQLQAAERLLTLNATQAKTCLTRAQSLAKTGLAEARRSIWALYTDTNTDKDLFQQLTTTAQTLSENTNIAIQTILEGAPYPLSAEQRLHLQRIAQESITNSLRHAQAQQIEMTLSYHSAFIQLQIQDDGQGFDSTHASEGFGLMGMQQRCDRIHATLTIHSQPEQGTQIQVVLPVRSDRSHV
jgi:signal transduction histidine kinase